MNNQFRSSKNLEYQPDDTYDVWSLTLRSLLKNLPCRSCTSRSAFTVVAYSPPHNSIIVSNRTITSNWINKDCKRSMYGRATASATGKSKNWKMKINFDLDEWKNNTNSDSSASVNLSNIGEENKRNAHNTDGLNLWHQEPSEHCRNTQCRCYSQL